MYETFSTIQPFIVSFIIGLFIGIERERSHPEGVKAAGVRTFILIAMLGTFAATIHDIAITIGLTLFVLGAILLGYYRSTRVINPNTDIGLTTEFSAAAVYCLGYLTPTKLLLCSIIGVIILFVLISRNRLHRFSRNNINAGEMRAAATLLIASLGILPFLPNHTIDPWHLFNPFRFGIILILIATMQFGGYVAVRAFGEKLGMVFMGFFGGLISSTVVFLTLPKLVEEQPNLIYPAIAAAACSITGTLCEFLVIVAIASPPLFFPVFVPVLAIILTCALTVFFALRNNTGKLVISKSVSPLDIKEVLQLGIIISSMIFIVGFTKIYFGANAVEIVAFLAGLFELHSITLATALLNHSGQISLNVARISLLLAVFATFISKYAIILTLARNKFGLLLSITLLIMIGMGALAFFFIPPTLL